MDNLTMATPKRIKYIWVHRHWIPWSDPLRIPIRENQTLTHALQSLGEKAPTSFFAVTSDGTQTPGEKLTGSAVRDDAIIRTMVMEAVEGGGIL